MPFRQAWAPAPAFAFSIPAHIELACARAARQFRGHCPRLYFRWLSPRSQYIHEPLEAALSVAGRHEPALLSLISATEAADIGRAGRPHDAGMFTTRDGLARRLAS